MIKVHLASKLEMPSCNGVVILTLSQWIILIFFLFIFYCIVLYLFYNSDIVHLCNTWTWYCPTYWAVLVNEFEDYGALNSHCHDKRMPCEIIYEAEFDTRWQIWIYFIGTFFLAYIMHRHHLLIYSLKFCTANWHAKTYSNPAWWGGGTPEI